MLKPGDIVLAPIPGITAIPVWLFVTRVGVDDGFYADHLETIIDYQGEAYEPSGSWGWVCNSSEIIDSAEPPDEIIATAMRLVLEGKL